jgi:hypothetical protein
MKLITKSARTVSRPRQTSSTQRRRSQRPRRQRSSPDDRRPLQKIPPCPLHIPSNPEQLPLVAPAGLPVGRHPAGTLEVASEFVAASFSWAPLPFPLTL